ncbi:MAG: MFS transporter [Aggregatilineales bacterium]
MTQTIHPAAKTLAPERVRLLLTIPTLAGSLDLTMITAFIAQLIFDLGISTAEGANIIVVYLITYTLGLFIGGRLSDFLGRRATFGAAMLCYAVGSALILVAPPLSSLGASEYVLILAGRAITGLGAGAVPAIAISTMCDLFPDPLRSIGIIGAVDVIGVLLGGLYGALIVQVLPWRGLFFFSLIIALGALVATFRALPNARQGSAGFDWLGALVLAGALISFNLGVANLERLAAQLDALSEVLGYFGVALLALGLFAVVERFQRRAPLLELAIFSKAEVVFSLLISALTTFSLFLMLVGLPLLANVNALGSLGIGVLLPPLRDETLQGAALTAGGLLLLYSGALALFTALGARLQERLGTLRTIVLGLGAALIGFIGLGLSVRGEISLWVGTFSGLAGAGIGTLFSPIMAIPLAATRAYGMMASFLLGVRMAAGSLVITSVSALSEARVRFLVRSLEAGHLPIELPPEITYKSFVLASQQMISELALIAAAIVLIALLPTLGLWRMRR